MTAPQPPEQPPGSSPTGPPGSSPTRPPGSPPTRPPDVDTGFWLWATALPLLVIGYVVDLVTMPAPGSALIVYAFSGVLLFVVTAVVVTFLVLLRQGYRWARTLLTGGGLAAVVYTGINLFSVDRPPAAAVAYAVTTIFGAVLIVGGAYLLHRKDAHGYFTR
ncbi:hypothetical protein [Mycolicibacterium thermoresistibile]